MLFSCFVSELLNFVIRAINFQIKLRVFFTRENITRAVMLMFYARKFTELYNLLVFIFLYEHHIHISFWKRRRRAN